MSAYWQNLNDTYHRVIYDYADPRTKDWFLTGSPWEVLTIAGCYLYFVYVFGPRMMRDRKPYNIDRIIQVYNLFQVFASLYLFIVPLYEVLLTTSYFNVFCQPIDFSDNPIAIKVAKYVWMFYMLKIIDLLDTIFFVLRKKFSQVTGLHVYHHTGMVVGSYFNTKYIAGGQVCSTGTINCIVHALMYSYYFLSSYNPEHKKNIWWKKYLTQIQILQFLLIIFHNCLVFFQPSCKFPRWIMVFYVPQNFLMLYLFLQFYVETYTKKEEKKEILKKIE